MRTKPLIFISYSHADRNWKNRVLAQLRVLEAESLVEIWDDSQIGAGDTWEPSIRNAMQRAQVAFLLISARFLISEFIRNTEVPALISKRTKGLRVFPLIVEQCDWQAVRWLSALQVRPQDGVPLKSLSRSKADTALASVTRELRMMIGARKRGKLKQSSRTLDPIAVSTGRLPLMSRHFFGREPEMKLLDQAWEDPGTKIVSVVAWGGVGKSALVSNWLRTMAVKQYRGAERVYAWSFFSQGTGERAGAGALFVEAALAWFGDSEPTRGSAWEKGERLACLIKSQRVLLVLDGLEPLQFPFGPQEGELKEQAVQALLRELAAMNSGLCVITTRLPVSDLAEFEGSSARRIDLEHLSPEAGSQILQALGVKGEPAELRQASSDFDGHCLALQLLGSFLTDVYRGEVAKRDAIGPLETDVRLGGQARRVMTSYERMFGPGAELALLRLLGFFNRPAEPSALAVLRARPAIPRLTETLTGLTDPEWRALIGRLRRARLISREDDDAETLDTHPLVREHFAEQLRASGDAAWKEGNRRLFEYFRQVAKPLPETLAEMEPLFQAVIHGCKAGLHQDAWRHVYVPRIARGHEGYAVFRLGAVTPILDVLAHFFENGQPVAPTLVQQGLNKDEQQQLLLDTGLYLNTAVSYSAAEAERYFAHARKLTSAIQNPVVTVTLLSAQWRCAVGKSKLAFALETAHEVHTIIRKAKNPDLLIGTARLFANPLFWLGRFRQSRRWAEQGLRIRDAESSYGNAGLFLTDPRINLMSFRAMTSWQLGFPDTALRQSGDAVQAARAFDHSHTLAVTLWMDALVSQFRREPEAVLQKAEAVIEVSAKKFASWTAIGQVLKGWALAQLGRCNEGIKLTERGMDGWHNAGLTLGRPYWLSLQAQSLAGADRPIEAFDAIEEALSITENSSDVWWEVELRRKKAELLLRLPNCHARAADSLRSAIDLAQRRAARTLELRVWTTAVRLRVDLGVDVRAALTALYGTFTEGHMSHDLVEAAAALGTH